MRSHPELNNKEHDRPSIIDLNQMSMLSGKQVDEKDNVKFNGLRVYKIHGENGLYTFSELQQRLTN